MLSAEYGEGATIVSDGGPPLTQYSVLSPYSRSYTATPNRQGAAEQSAMVILRR